MIGELPAPEMSLVYRYQDNWQWPTNNSINDPL